MTEKKRCEPCDRFLAVDEEHLAVAHTKIINLSRWRNILAVVVAAQIIVGVILRFV